MPIFNDRLKKLRQQQRWTMKELAEEINKFVDSPFSVSSVSNWENKGSEPPYNILCAIAKAFNVSSDYLIGLSDQATNTNIPSLQANENTKKGNSINNQNRSNTTRYTGKSPTHPGAT
ncbi:helix-turn-helix domain-containing protein [Bacillus paranthracis]